MAAVTRTANIAMVVTDRSQPRTDDKRLVVVYKCDECFALIAEADARAHLWWHDSLMHHKNPREVKRGS